MSDPATGLAYAQLGSDILGSAFGRKRNRHSVGELARRAARTESIIYGRRFKSIVAGAKAAGIHPLAALGSSAGQGGPGVMVGQSDSGGWKSEAMQGVSKFFGRMQAINAKTELTEAQAELSRARALENSAAGQSVTEAHPLEKSADGIPQRPTVVPEAEAHKGEGLVSAEASIQRSRSTSDSSRSAGSNPAWMQVEIWPGVFADVPWSEEGPAESIDNLNALVLTVARNAGIGYKKAYDHVQGVLARKRAEARARSRKLARYNPRSRRIEETERKRRAYLKNNFNVRKYLRRGIAGRR